MRRRSGSSGWLRTDGRHRGRGAAHTHRLGDNKVDRREANITRSRGRGGDTGRTQGRRELGRNASRQRDGRPVVHHDKRRRGSTIRGRSKGLRRQDSRNGQEATRAQGPPNRRGRSKTLRRWGRRGPRRTSRTRATSRRLGLLIAVAHELAKVRALTAKQGWVRVDDGLPRPTSHNANPNERRKGLGDVQLDTHPGSMGFEQAGGVPIDLEHRPDAPGDGANQDVVEEISWESRQLQPNGD